MKIEVKKTMDEVIYFPSIWIHKRTHCVAIFTHENRYIVLDVGNQVDEEVCKAVTTNYDVVKNWEPFSGKIILSND